MDWHRTSQRILAFTIAAAVSVALVALMRRLHAAEPSPPAGPPAALASAWCAPVAGLQARLVLAAAELEAGTPLAATLELRAAPGARVNVPDLTRQPVLRLTSMGIRILDERGNELPLLGPQTGMSPTDLPCVDLEGDRVLALPVELAAHCVSEYVPDLKDNARQVKTCGITQLTGRFVIQVSFALGPRAGYFGMGVVRWPDGAWSGRLLTPTLAYTVRGAGAAFVPWGEPRAGLVARLTAGAEGLNLTLRNYRTVLLREEGYSGPAPETPAELDRMLYREAPALRVGGPGTTAALHAVNTSSGETREFVWPAGDWGGDLAPGADLERRAPIAAALAGLPAGTWRVTWRLRATGPRGAEAASERGGDGAWRGELESNAVMVETEGGGGR